MSKSERAEQLVSLLASIEVGAAGDAAAARALAGMEPVEAAHTLKVLVAEAKTSPKVGQALASLSRALMFASDADLPYTHRGRIYDAAAEFHMVEVAALFSKEPPIAAIDPDAPPAQDPTLQHLTLGHKKMLARQANPDRIARLAVEGDARVIRELLLNPRMTEATVVRIVARRPAKAEVLLEVWRSPRWSSRAGVRKALAMNPYTPPEVALKVLPHLLAADLRAIAGDQSLHPSVRQLAGKLANRRTSK